jgi:hypothetical protein
MDKLDLESEANVRAESYFIACSTATCRYCSSNTKVVGLLVPSGHRVRSQDDDDGPGRDTWECAPRQALLFDLQSLPDPVRDQMQRLAPSFRLAAGPGSEALCWVNHCERCGRIQQDHELFCEPEGAFVPLDAGHASAIELVPIEEELAAVAAGYAPDPEFIGFESGG